MKLKNKNVSLKKFKVSIMQMKLICIILMILLFTGRSFSQTTRSAGTEADFNTAYTSSATNDIINITNNIVITSEIALSKTITISGNGFTITVPNPGLDDMGVFNTGASTFRVFNISGSVTVAINQLTIKGGSVPSNDLGDGRDNSIFSGGALSRITYGTGTDTRHQKYLVIYLIV